MIKIILALLLIAPAVMADEKTGLTNETGLGYVVTGGNSESESTSVKHASTYTWTRDILKFTGHYLQSSGLVETQAATLTEAAVRENRATAENWAATLRFERVLTPKTFNAFLAHGWYGDRFQGVREGHSTDIGAKYYWVNSDSTKFFSELGYRYTRELLQVPAAADVGVGSRIMPEYHYVRAFSQVDYSHSKTLAVGVWVEYTPSITSFADDQRLNYSPYLTSVLTDMFSLKVAYEGRYRFKPAVAGNKLTDFTFTTALLAKF